MNIHIRVGIFTAVILSAAATFSFSGNAAAQELTMYSWREQEKPLWEYISKNGLIKGVTIKYVRVAPDNYDTKLRIDLQSGGVDLFQGRAGAAWLSSFIDAGSVAPLAFELTSINGATLAAGQGPDGRQYGVPFAVQMQSILYNKSVFNSNGIEVPRTPKEFAAAATKLKAAGVTPIAFGARSGWWLGQVVGEVMTAGLLDDATAQGLIEGTVCFTDPAFVKTLKTFKQWKDAGWMNSTPLADDYNAMRTSVALGEAAMMLDGSWSSGPASVMYEIDPKLQIGFLPVPGDNAKVYAFGDGAYLVNEKGDKATAAKKVLEFTTTREFAELFVSLVGEIPAYGGKYEIKDARLSEIAKTIARNAATPTPFFAYSLNSGKPSYGQLVADGYQKLLSDSITPEKLAMEIQTGLNSWKYVGADNCAL